MGSFLQTRSLESRLAAFMRAACVWLGICLFFVSRAFSFEWTLIKHDGRDYVPVDDVAKFYSFGQTSYSGDMVRLEGATLRMQGGVNSRELYLNGLKFILSYPVIKVDNKVLLSRIDLSKLVDPVLRPARIQGAPAKTIVLDAGHGGYDQGALGTFGSEKDFAFDVVMRARDLLTRAGYSVRLTRSSDVFLPLESRANFANRQRNAIFVSVHFNAGRPDSEGIETFGLAPQGVPSTNDYVPSINDFRPCVGNVRDSENIALATAMHTALITKMRTYDRGIKRARFVVLRDINIPGVLIEGGFLSNSQDGIRIATPQYRQLLAQSILQGVQSYNRAMARGTGQIMAKRDTTPGGGQTSVPKNMSIWDPLKAGMYVLPERN
jgi:N-acetylmuramoyl-L-alanine amidase